MNYSDQANAPQNCGQERAWRDSHEGTFAYYIINNNLQESCYCNKVISR